MLDSATMAMVFSTSPKRWNPSWSARGWVLPFLLLIALAPGTPAQQPVADEKGKITTQNVPAPSEQSSETVPPQPPSSLRLQTGDLIDIAVYNVPELTTKARISTKGEIYLPLIDYVHIAGLTAEEAEGLIQKRLSDGGFVKNPHVTLFVDQYASQGASILGEVVRPGVYPVPGSNGFSTSSPPPAGSRKKQERALPSPIAISQKSP